MTDKTKIESKAAIARVDDFVFVKNYYSVWTHLIPFAVAALLLLILSIPTDNLLLRLAKVLDQPSLIWIPAGLLTLVAAVVYVATIRVQIRRAYLWSNGDLRRTIGTSLFYIILCSFMAYLVLRSGSLSGTSWGDIWACFLVAVLSLTGIGWSVPSSWVKSVGVQSPDYTEGRLSAQKLARVLRYARSKPTGDKQDVEDFAESVKNLYSSIQTNLQLEPKWTKKNLESAMKELRAGLNHVKTYFPTDNVAAIQDFAAACRYQKESQYGDFIETLKKLSNYWRELQYKKLK